MEERCTLAIELKFGVCFVIRRKSAGWSLREVSWRRRRSPGFGRVLLESSDQGICGEVGVELSRRRSPLGGKMPR